MDRGDRFPQVLLIEDNPTDMELMKDVFEKHVPSDQIQVLRDAAEALDFFHGPWGHRNCVLTTNIKLIVVDLKLPLADGLFVLQHFMSEPNVRIIPIVVFTSSSELRDIDSTYRLGVNSYVVKPVNSDRFIQRVREVATYWLSLNQAPLE